MAATANDRIDGDIQLCPVKPIQSATFVRAVTHQGM